MYVPVQMQSAKSADFLTRRLFRMICFFHQQADLDPHISIEAAIIQVNRIAAARKVDKSVLIQLIETYTERQLPFYGKTFVHVLKLNKALDEKEEHQWQ